MTLLNILNMNNQDVIKLKKDNPSKEKVMALIGMMWNLDKMSIHLIDYYYYKVGCSMLLKYINF